MQRARETPRTLDAGPGTWVTECPFERPDTYLAGVRDLLSSRRRANPKTPNVPAETQRRGAAPAEQQPPEGHGRRHLSVTSDPCVYACAAREGGPTARTCAKRASASPALAAPAPLWARRVACLHRGAARTPT